MMTGYHGQPEKTREAEWFSPAGQRYIRTGDIGRFDADGFLTLFDRKKDMIISGGFNLYPSDLEAQLREHPAVHEVAVVGVPSDEWGETPVAFVERRAGDETTDDELRAWLNARVGKTQRLAALRVRRRTAAQPHRQGAQARTARQLHRPALTDRGTCTRHASRPPLATHPDPTPTDRRLPAPTAHRRLAVDDLPSLQGRSPTPNGAPASTSPRPTGWSR